MTHQLELLNICKEFKIDPLKHKKLSMLFKWQHKAVVEFLEMERPVMIIIVLSRITKNGRTTNFMSNLIWDGTETKTDVQLGTKYFNDCVDEVIESIGSCLRKSEPVLFVKTMTTPLNLCKFLDTRLHQKRYTKVTPVNINEFDINHFEKDLVMGEKLSVKYLENCSLIHQLLPLKSDLSGISLIMDVTTDPILVFSQTCEMFKQIKFKNRSGDIYMLFYNANPVINGEVIVNKFQIEHFNPRVINSQSSRIYDVKLAKQMKNARLFVHKLKLLVSNKIRVVKLIKSRVYTLLGKIRNQKKYKAINSNDTRNVNKTKFRPRPPDREGKYRVSVISYVEQLDWCIFRERFEFRVKRADSKQTYSENVVVKELMGSWRKIWLAVYWLFLDYKDINKYGMNKDTMVKYLKTQNIISLSKMIEIR